MRIWIAARVMPAHGLAGGMERQTDTLARRLVQRGHEVTVVTTAHPAGRREVVEGGVTVVYLPGSSWRRYSPAWWDASYAALRGGHANRPYDVALSISAGALGYLVRMRRDIGLGTAALLQGSARGELLTAWRGARTARGIYRLGRSAWRIPVLLARWRRVSRAVAAWLAVSPSVAEDVARELGLSPKTVRVVPNGVDPDQFRPDPAAGAALRRQLGLPDRSPTLVSTSRLEREKGIHVLLDALMLLRTWNLDARLVVAGGGHDAAFLRERARRLGVAEAVVFLGQVEHARLPAVYAAADAFVLPSFCHEGLPLSLLEAQASGLPVVTSAVGGIPDVVQAESCRLVRRGDAHALAANLHELLADAGLQRSMGRAARRDAETRFGIDTVAEATEAVLLAVAGRGG